MPTPVNAARQCLAGDAAAALDEAVSVACRRSHPQTTSLHVVSALLSSSSSPSPILRDALSRSRTAAPASPRLLLRALEHRFTAALDRLPSGASSSSSSSDAAPAQPAAEPPVSNSLMAAIKRSQANQRRNPETFHLYQQQQLQQQGPFAGVKVELQQLVLAMLDDPVVSRVLGEAGFRSCDVKLAVLRPHPSTILLRSPSANARCPPLFLSSFSSDGFPFSRQLLSSDGTDENRRRIGDLLARDKGRSPLLVGAGAADALRDFTGVVGRRDWAALPPGLAGMRLLSIEDEVTVTAHNRSLLERKLEQLQKLLADGVGPGVLLSLGDLKGFVDDSGIEDGAVAAELTTAVAEVTRLIGTPARRLWVIGAAASYEAYMKFLARYPSVDKDWDLQLLPITSAKVESPSSYAKPNSMVGSFIPLGGFYPLTASPITPSKLHQPGTRCNKCNEKYELEVAAVLKEHSFSASDINRSNMPSWLQNSESPRSANLDFQKAMGSSTVLKEKCALLQKKWEGPCQHLTKCKDVLESDAYGPGAEAFQRLTGYPFMAGNQIWNEVPKNHNVPHFPSSWNTIIPSQKVASPRQSFSVSTASDPSNENISSQLNLNISNRLEKPEAGEPMSSSGFPPELDHHDIQASPSSTTSVSTELVLGTIPVSPCKEGRPVLEAKLSSLGTTVCLPFHGGASVTESISVQSFSSSPRVDYHLTVRPQINAPARGSGSPEPDKTVQLNWKDYKALCSSLIEVVGRQQDAIYQISEAIIRCKSGNGRPRGLWFSFLGPDRIAKKKIAAALVEILFGGKGRLVSIDLELLSGISNSDKICGEQCPKPGDTSLRGKLAVDQIADEIRNKPSSVVFIENVNKADMLLQKSLLQAIGTGRFADSHGREVNITNTTFILTTGEVKDKNMYPVTEAATFSEENVLAAKKWKLKILFEPISSSVNIDADVKRLGSCFPLSVRVKKRKLDTTVDRMEQGMAKHSNKLRNTSFDLNVPFEETEASNMENNHDDDDDEVLETSESWLEAHYESLDKVLVFKPFDFNTLSMRILKEINEIIQNTIGPKCLLEVDPKAMEQILAATLLLENFDSLSKWLQKVLSRSFVEARERYDFSLHNVLRLVTCEDEIMDEQAPGICLPSSIILS